jgi:hypothetical protein
MKKLILTITVLGALAFNSFAQDGSKKAAGQEPQLTIEQRADKETTKAAAALSLTEAQKVKFKQFTIDRFNANQPLREKAKATTNKAEKETIHAQMKANTDKYFANVNGILTAEQQPRWAEHKKKFDAKHADKSHE